MARRRPPRDGRGTRAGMAVRRLPAYPLPVAFVSKRIRSSGVVAASLVLSIGCREPAPLEFSACDRFYMDMRVYPVDAITAEPVVRGATVVITGPADVDSVTVAPDESDGIVNAYTNSGFFPSTDKIRTGWYSARVSHPDYVTWQQNAIRVRVEGCDVRTDDGPIVAQLVRVAAE